MEKFKKIFNDVIINIISNMLPIAVLQLIVLPRIAKTVGDIKYGQIVTIIGLFAVIAEPLGCALENARLLQNNKYVAVKEEGDFNFILAIFVVIDVILTPLFSYLYGEIGILNLLLITIISIMFLLKQYWGVAFRLNINYGMILVSNIILSIGYCTGLIFFEVTGSWVWVYVVGIFLSLLFVMKKGKLQKETKAITSLFNDTFKTVSVLTIVELLNGFCSYADRLLLYPLLGAQMVSIYYSASIISKMIAMIISPMSTVFLSYFAKMKEFSKKNFLVMLGLTTIFGIIAYFVCIIISKPLLSILYKQWALESYSLIKITTFTACVKAIYMVARPAVLKFRSIQWQIIMNVTDVIFYIVLGYIGVLLNGIVGFCYALLIQALIQLFIRVLVFLLNKN